MNVLALTILISSCAPLVQAALDAAVAGDLIRVGPGTYQENLDFKQKNIDGSNVLELVAMTTDGREIKARRTVTIVDTTAPEINARLVDRRSGKALSSIDSRAMNFVIVKIDTRDACNLKPMVESIIGTETKDGDTLRLQGRDQLIAGC